MNAHNVLLHPLLDLIDDDLLSPGEFDDTYLETVNNINDNSKFENELLVVLMDISSSSCFINHAKILLDVGANVNVLHTDIAKRLDTFNSTLKRNILSCDSNLDTYEIVSSYSITYKGKTIHPKRTTVAKNIPYGMIMNIQTCGLLGISIVNANENMSINDPFKEELRQMFPEAISNFLIQLASAPSRHHPSCSKIKRYPKWYVIVFHLIWFLKFNLRLIA